MDTVQKGILCQTRLKSRDSGAVLDPITGEIKALHETVAQEDSWGRPAFHLEKNINLLNFHPLPANQDEKGMKVRNKGSQRNVEQALAQGLS
jgi:hypothetical protein